MPSPEISDRIDERLEELYRRHRSIDEDEVAKYYDSKHGYLGPEGAGQDADAFGICLVTPDGEVHSAGDAEAPFAVQSTSKVFVYGLALADRGRDHVLERVGVEPSGDPFNAIDFDQRNHRPRNPMVNAGVATTVVPGGLRRALSRVPSPGAAALPRPRARSSPRASGAARGSPR